MFSCVTSGFRYSADMLAHMFTTYILYPRLSHPYLVLAAPPEDTCDELDLFDQVGLQLDYNIDLDI